MRNFSVIELLDYKQFLRLEAYQPWTFYYWPVEKGPGHGEMPDTWNTWENDTFGGAVMLDHGDPMELVSVDTIRELVTRQEYVTSSRVREIIAEGGGNDGWDRTLISDSWNTTGPIAGSRLAHSSIGEAHWSASSTGTVMERWSGNYLLGPAQVEVEFQDLPASLTSEPINVVIEFEFTQGSQTTFTYDDPLIVIAPMGTDGDKITLYGKPADDKLTVAIDREFSGVSKRVTQEISLKGNMSLNRWMCMAVFYPTGIQFSSPGEIVINNQIYTDRYANTSHFNMKLGNGIGVHWFKVDRVRETRDN